MRLSILHLAFSLLLSAFCSATPRLEKVSSDLLPGEWKSDSTDSVQSRKSKTQFPDFRSIKDWKTTDVLLVNDIDGNLHGVSRMSGALLWTLPTSEPLISVEIGNYETLDSGKDESSNLTWLIEPYADGSLYYFTPEFGLNKLPGSIKELVLESPFSLGGDDKIYTGNRRTSLHKVNINTGRVHSSFGDCQNMCPAPDVSDSASFMSQDYIMIGKTTYELSINSKTNSNVLWNVTYSQWGPNKIDADLIAQNQHSIDDVYFTPFHETSLLALNKNQGSPLWISKLPALAVNVFDVFADTHGSSHVLLPHPLKVLNDAQIGISISKSHDLAFVNKTGSNWFVMSFLNYPTLINSAPYSKYQLALYKMQNSFPDETLHALKEYPTNVTIDNYIKGVHEVFYLNGDNHYQPISKFEKVNLKKVTDENNESTELSQVGNLPKLFEGFDMSKELSLPELSSQDLVEGELHSYIEERSILNNIKAYSVLVTILLTCLIIGVLVSTFTLEFTLSFSFSKTKSRSKASTLKYEINTKQGSGEPTSIEENDGNHVFSIDEMEDSDVLEVKTLGEENTISDDLREDLSSNPYIDASQDESFSRDDDFSSKKKRKRGGRGGKRGGKKQTKNKSTQSEADANNQNKLNGGESDFPRPSKKETQRSKNLHVSDKILGYGSHGTVVYEGSFENRSVAIKRILLDFYDVANREVSLLQESDDHPNVVRYYCSETSESEKFHYIALELCSCSLEDLVEKPKFRKELKTVLSDCTSALYQLASGLDYLHSLKILHRDLKPQNILISDLRKVQQGKDIRLLVSDFGLCKKLDYDQSSFRAVTNQTASGTVGWRAPELLLNNEISGLSPDTASTVSDPKESGRRLTKSLDIFSMGCVFYYVLTRGDHPFGSRFVREGNIVKGDYDLSGLKKHVPGDYVEANHLISSMISFDPSIRPNTGQILKHPFFWSSSVKLEFLLKVSDRVESERNEEESALLSDLESSVSKVLHGSWFKRFNKVFMENLGKYRKYDETKVMDLLRVVRNKYHHFNDMPIHLRDQMSPFPDKFYSYFSERFPDLLMEIYMVVERNLKEEHVFTSFYYS